MTNFERIVETPEKAAEFFDKMLDEIIKLDEECYSQYPIWVRKENLEMETENNERL